MGTVIPLVTLRCDQVPRSVLGTWEMLGKLTFIVAHPRVSTNALSWEYIRPPAILAHGSACSQAGAVPCSLPTSSLLPAPTRQCPMQLKGSASACRVDSVEDGSGQTPTERPWQREIGGALPLTQLPLPTVPGECPGCAAHPAESR